MLLIGLTRTKESHWWSWEHGGVILWFGSLSTATSSISTALPSGDRSPTTFATTILYLPPARYICGRLPSNIPESTGDMQGITNADLARLRHSVDGIEFVRSVILQDTGFISVCHHFVTITLLRCWFGGYFVRTGRTRGDREWDERRGGSSLGAFTSVATDIILPVHCQWSLCDLLVTKWVSEFRYPSDICQFLPFWLEIE